MFRSAVCLSPPSIRLEDQGSLWSLTTDRQSEVGVLRGSGVASLCSYGPLTVTALFGSPVFWCDSPWGCPGKPFGPGVRRSLVAGFLLNGGVRLRPPSSISETLLFSPLPCPRGLLCPREGSEPRSMSQEADWPVSTWPMLFSFVEHMAQQREARS